MIRGLVATAVAQGATQKEACSLLGLDPRTAQRWLTRPDGDRRNGPTQAPRNKLSEAERTEILRVLNTQEFRDLPPNVVVAILADRGIYLASQSTIYRVLREAGQLAHRTGAKPPVKRVKPKEACADAPNRVWSWDITYLSSDVRGAFFRLYMIMDIYSRKIVGWAVHESELGEHAAALIRTARDAENSQPGLILHSDNGGPMKAATMLATMKNLGVVASFSRPQVSDDNPYSEAMFRTLKYCPAYPPRGVFTSLCAARAWVEQFVNWYNYEHRHSGIKYVTPNERHEGRDVAILEQRAALYAGARKRRPERWAKNTRNWSHIKVVRLNPDVAAQLETAS